MLRVHRAERADRLADALAGVLREPLGDPFTPEIVSVPSRGVERWLAQRLSHHLGAGAPAHRSQATARHGPAETSSDIRPGVALKSSGGVCANVEFPGVPELIARATDKADTDAPREDPWHPDRLVWPVLDVIDGSLHEDWCRPLATYLDGDEIRRGRRYATARHLAGLFTSYALHRPEMLRQWTAGSDTGVPGDLRWQPELWRRLTRHLAEPDPATRLSTVQDLLHTDPQVSSLPGRLSVFGLTRLPAAHIAVLAALAEHRDVHLWLPHPSPALWEAVRPYARKRTRLPRRDDPTAALPRHPLLASLGRDARELQLLLAAPGVPVEDHHYPAGKREAATTQEPMQGAPDTQLRRLQQAITDDTSTTQAIGPADSSVQVHACHGPGRQVEVLRETVLHLLADDPTLEPRDILVMCPDIETFAPLVSASFGLGSEAAHPAHRLRVKLADRALRQVNPLFGVAARLLELAGARVTAAQVLDLIAAAPVRRRFGLRDDDLDRLRDLVVHSGVRWGLDAAHRARWKLDGVRPNTWEAGLDRVLLGVAMSEDELSWLGTALPLDDVDAGDVDLVGRLAEFTDRLTSALASLSGEHPPQAWLDALVAAVDALTAVPDADSWQAAQLRAELTAEPVDTMLTLPDVRSLLDERLRGRPTRANFRTGDLTICTMVPMRSVPHRVVCVLGLDDGVFPRSAGVDGDDVLARDPCAGERDPRGEDRQLLLDAVMAATDKLVLLYSGADERTNAPRPPAVPLDEMLDVLGTSVTRHPLQPFDQRNFAAGAPFSFDPVALAGAEAGAGPRRADPPFLATPLQSTVADVTSLDDLKSFVEHPVRAFLRRRLGLSFFTDDADPGDGLPVELDGLQRWAVGERLLQALLRGADLDRCVQAEWRRGTVPPGPLGRRLLQAMADEVAPLAAAAQTHLTGTPTALDVSLTLPDGRRLDGTVSGVHGNCAVVVSYARISPKHRLRAWLTVLALTAARPGTPWQAVTIGRGTGGVRRCTYGPLGPETARRTLHDLVGLHDEGMREPLPLPAKSSHAYARCRLRNGTAEAAQTKAAAEWSRFQGIGENEDAGHAMVLGDHAPFDRLLTAAGTTEPTRFGELAMRLWRPLCAAEREDQP
ncbi:exodeoxyribonuclease V subunit gamma [Symbioplanes lichenis]|uniref:exodeoxyribonuclease V subunit gamma n=1 Tax=Symbioplanes lichenis TaxID=1629072 RepID=UPI0027383EB8|nr:exodeoxyribonuclease V subunit gamma [Actinoplanes lichenis]